MADERARFSAESLYWYLPLPCQHALFRAYGWWYTRRRVNRRCNAYLAEMRNRRTWSLADIEAYQSERLQELVRHAVQTVPYYSNLFRERRLRPDDIRTLADLAKLPTIAKDTVRRSEEAMISSRARRIPHLRDRSGGSSGVPLSFLLPKDLRFPFAAAASLAIYEHAGYRFGAPHVTLAARRICEGRPFWRYNRAANQLFLSSKDLTADTAPEFAERIRSFGPQFVTGHPTIIGFLADCLNEQGTPLPVTAVITSSETLDPGTRASIESAFDAPVFDTYGMGEQVIMAGECAEHDGMHIVPSYGIAEVVDGDGNPTDGLGRVVGTSLRNDVMPLLRYDTGDIARLERTPCRCGCEHVRLVAMEGRTDDLVCAADGSTVFPSTIRKSILALPGIRRFQLVQHEDGTVTLRIERPEPLNDELTRRVRRAVGECLRGDHVVRSVEAVEALSRTAGQKVRLVIREP